MQIHKRWIAHRIGQLVAASCLVAICSATAWAEVRAPRYGSGIAGHVVEGPTTPVCRPNVPVQDRLRTRRSWCWTRRIVARSEQRSPMGAAISVSGCRPEPISCMCEWSIFLGVRRLKRRCAGITLPSYASTATRGFGELARNDNRGARLIRPQASRGRCDHPRCARSFKRNTHRAL